MLRSPLRSTLFPYTTLFRSKIMKDLVAGGLVQSHIGSKGGFTLAKGASAISIKDVYETVERPLDGFRSEEHTSELQSRGHLVCRLLLEKKKKKTKQKSTQHN